MADEQGFKVGDIVQLRSGSPHLTVTWTGDSEVACKYWNDKTAEFGSVIVPPEALVISG